MEIIFQEKITAPGSIQRTHIFTYSRLLSVPGSIEFCTGLGLSYNPKFTKLWSVEFLWATQNRSPWILLNIFTHGSYVFGRTCVSAWLTNWTCKSTTTSMRSRKARERYNHFTNNKVIAKAFTRRRNPEHSTSRTFIRLKTYV